MKNIPGRKTDQKDAEWIADLLAHGLLRASFVPPRETRNLRDLTRYRVKLVEERNRIHSRVAKVLEDANIKLSSVASDILGTSGRNILTQIANGCERPDELAYRAINRLRASRAEVRRALYGDVSEHHRYMLRHLLDEFQHVEEKISEIQTEIRKRMQPHQAVIERLMTIPGVDMVTAWTLIAELGLEMKTFADADHAASWAGLVPGSYESAGKRKSTSTRHGNRWLRRALCQSAWAVSRKKDCQLTALFYRRACQHGVKKAIVATAHRLLVIAYYLLRDGGVYRERGGDFYDRLHPERTARRLTKRLERLGAEVIVKWPAPPTATAPKRGRGRPCKCAERSIPCPHDRNKSEGSWPPTLGESNG